jgi:hypothetical protein
MKSLCTVVFVIFVATAVNAQSDSIRMLSCSTWGKPDWTKVETYFRNSFNPFGSAIREYDHNIRSLSLRSAEVYSDEVFIRWLLADTAIQYKVVITNQLEEVVYVATTNKCGVRIPFKMLREETSSSLLSIAVERNNKGSLSWGFSVNVDEARKFYREDIEEDLPKILANVPEDQRTMAIVNYFIKDNYLADALYTLELAIEKDPDNEALKKKYWLIINDLIINNKI